MQKPFFFQMAVKEVLTADNGEVRVRGYASTPDLDRYRDIVEPSAFTKALGTYMTNPVVLRSHDADRPVGLVEGTKVTDKGLWVEAVIKDAATAEEVKAGLFRAFSIGYIPTKTELRNKDNEPIGTDEDPWSRDNIRVIKELDLVEISVVSTPANATALFSLAKSLKAFSRQLALKSFGDVKAGDVPENEAKAGNEAASEPLEDEDDVADAAEATESEGEKPVESAPVEDGTKDEDKSKKKSTTSSDEAEKTGEMPVTDDAEGGDKPTEEANAGAEPKEESGDESEDESKGAMVLTKDIVDALPHLKAAGIVREAAEGDKPVKMTKAVAELVKTLHDALASENKRANDEEKRANILQAKLNATPEKKGIATHRQFSNEEVTERTSPNGESSAWFKGLFKSR